VSPLFPFHCWSTTLACSINNINDVIARLWAQGRLFSLPVSLLGSVSYVSHSDIIDDYDGIRRL